jgi:hypothetical protein
MVTENKEKNHAHEELVVHGHEHDPSLVISSFQL